MADITPLLAVWILLCLVMVGYVIYRFRANKSSGSPLHPLHPLVRNPTDPSLPARGAWPEWVAFACLMVGVSGLIVILVAEAGFLPTVPHVDAIAGSAVLLGIAVLAFSRGRRRK